MSTTDKARAYQQRAAPIAAQLNAALGPPSDFIDALGQRILALDRAIAAKDAARSRHVVAREAIERALAAGFAALGLLDTIVRHRYAEDRGTLAAWSIARRIERSHARRAENPPEHAAA